jgi:hypothetical protein
MWVGEKLNVDADFYSMVLLSVLVFSFWQILTCVFHVERKYTQASYHYFFVNLVALTSLLIVRDFNYFIYLLVIVEFVSLFIAYLVYVFFPRFLYV